MKGRSETFWIKFCCFFCLIISLAFLFGFMHGRSPFSWSGFELQTDVVGQYGDFVGGVIGTILSVFLLYLTFRAQHKDLENHVKVYKGESLYNLFFHMLDLYNNTLEHFIEEDEDGNRYVGKEALHYKYEQFYNDFDSQNCIDPNKSRKHALYYFQMFYSMTEDFSPIFFRTIYGAVSLLNNEDKDTEPERIRLMKLLRSQLTNTELIMLRYNAMTVEGRKFKALIVKFNLLKHLRPMDLLEYKYWSDKMTYEERGYTNVLLIIMRNNLTKVLKGKHLIESYSNNIMLYNTHVSLNKAGNELQICLYIKNNIMPNKSSLIKGILKLTPQDRISLLHHFAYDYFVVSSFNLVNKYNDILIVDIDDTLNGKWYVRVSTKDGSKLKSDVN